MTQMNKRILITGGAGFIGSHTVWLLNSSGYETLVYDSLVDGYEQALPGTSLVKGDLADFSLLNDTISNFKPDAVIHFAATANVPDSVVNPAGYYTNNITNGINLLNAMKNNNVSCIVFSSSAAVYGNPTNALITEEASTIPITPYGRTKLYFEEILRDFDRAYGIRSVSLRYFCAAGSSFDGSIGESHKAETHLIPTVLRSILGVVPQFRVFGNDFPTNDGTGVRDYVHVVDMADAHVRSLEYLLNGGNSDCFNIGTGRGFSVMEIIRSAENITGQKVNYSLAPRREGDPAVLVADPSKIRRVMGWEARYGLNDMVYTAWNWYKKNPNGYVAMPKKTVNELLLTLNEDIKFQMDHMDISKISFLAEKIKEVSDKGGTIFIVGNGGSASVASHLACDLQKTTINSDLSHDKRKVRAICLTDNIPLMTAWANDTSYDEAFAQQLITLATPNDMVIVMSVSGNSESIVKLLDAAKKIGAYSYGLLGNDGGKCITNVNDYLLFNIKSFSVVESMFSTVSHMITDALRELLTNDKR
jgi:UDP-glucose 4-epimerase